VGEGGTRGCDVKGRLREPRGRLISPWSGSSRATASCPAGAVYRSHRPTETQDADPIGWGVLSWVERDFRSYLR
jgi:hypothetical protein